MGRAGPERHLHQNILLLAGLPLCLILEHSFAVSTALFAQSPLETQPLSGGIRGIIWCYPSGVGGPQPGLEVLLETSRDF